MGENILSPEDQTRRVSDKSKWNQFYYGQWSNWIRDATMVFTVGIATLAVFVVHLEGKKREDQFCASSEREHATLVRQYKDTLEYIDKLKEMPERLQEPINQFVISRLPDTESRARKDTAPPLCDKKSVKTLNPFSEPTEVGLPEPDPVLPKRTAKEVLRSIGPLSTSQKGPRGKPGPTGPRGHQGNQGNPGE